MHGIGHFHPESEISNSFLEELDIGTNHEWIVERVGIHSRRSVLPLDYIRTTRNADPREAPGAALYSNPQLATRAAEMAIRRAGIVKEQIGMVISGSSSADSLTPAEACYVANELGLEVPALDINSACTTFLAHLSVFSWMDPAKLPEYVLVVSVESLTKVVDYRDRSTAVLFGDGASAAVLSTRVPAPVQVIHSDMESSPAGAAKVRIPHFDYFTQDGRAVQMFAIRRTQEGYERLREAVTAEGVSERKLHFVGHQANLRVLEQVCRRCDIPPELHHANVEFFGNTGSVSAPSVVSMQWEKFQPNDDVALVAVGGGLTWARSLLRFGSGS